MQLVWEEIEEDFMEEMVLELEGVSRSRGQRNEPPVRNVGQQSTAMLGIRNLGWGHIGTKDPGDQLLDDLGTSPHRVSVFSTYTA